MPKTVFVSATGKYLQGDLTPQLFRDLVESYDPKVYEAGAFVAHSTKWAEAGINEPPRLASVRSLSDSMIGSDGRVYLSTDIEPGTQYEEAQQFFPHKSIEFWDAADPRNPLNQPHIPSEKQGKPYFRGYALLGDSPAAKLPAAITKFFGPLTDDKKAELSQYCDAAAGLYLYSDNSRTKPYTSMKKIAAACGLDEAANEDQIVAEIGKMKGGKTAKHYQDEIDTLTAKIVTLETSAGHGSKEYSDRITELESSVSTLRKEKHELKVAGMVREAQSKNITVGADKLERLKTYADRDFRDGDEKYTLATSFLDDIPTVKPGSVAKVPGEVPAAGVPKKEEIKTYGDFLDLRGDKAVAFKEAYADYVEELRKDF
ncbi:MAG: hypothetical protein HGB35_00060 [Geobacteraceae bacterium]|nr:hypothetical protein [Geobacteraceae bacterium]